MALLAALASCGGAGNEAASEPTPTLDPMEDFQIADLPDKDDATDDGDDFVFPEIDLDAVGFADETDLGDVGPSTRPTPPPLEDLVIDQGVRADEVGVLLDEGTALACAHAEFALDAVYEANDADLAAEIAAAAEYGGSSADPAVAAAMADLADRAGDTDVQDAVIAALRACSASGYDL